MHNPEPQQSNLNFIQLIEIYNKVKLKQPVEYCKEYKIAKEVSNRKSNDRMFEGHLEDVDMVDFFIDNTQSY